MLRTVTNKTYLWLAEDKKGVYLDQIPACCHVFCSTSLFATYTARDWAPHQKCYEHKPAKGSILC